MTPGWTNVRDTIAASGRPQGFVSRRARIALVVCLAVSALLWVGLYSIVR
jgi:hypothetical protein